MSSLSIIKLLRKKLKKLFKNENTGHDISHLERVLKNALEIQKNEGGDIYVIAVSALVHDVHRLMSTQLKHHVSADDSLDYVKQILIDCNVKTDKIEEILEIVKNHDNKNEKNFSLETLIVQDADVLDAIGKIGLKRTLKYCKTKKIPLTSSKPLNCKEYIPDINPISTCHYIYRTMIPNAENLYTKTAKQMAQYKVKILKKFVENHY